MKFNVRAFAVISGVILLAGLIGYDLWDDHFCKKVLISGEIDNKSYIRDVFKESARNSTMTRKQWISLLLGIIIGLATPKLADKLLAKKNNDFETNKEDYGDEEKQQNNN